MIDKATKVTLQLSGQELERFGILIPQIHKIYNGCPILELVTALNYNRG
jgi:hypothetical protein